MEENKNIELKTGDLVEVTLKKDHHKFKCIVVESYEGAFVGKVLYKEEGVGTATWDRYGLEKDGRFQVFEDCESVKVLAKPQKFKGTGTLTLNESVAKSNMVYYKTPLEEGKFAIFCLCEDYGGWSFKDETEESIALKESFFNSQLSKLSTTSNEVNE